METSLTPVPSCAAAMIQTGPLEFRNIAVLVQIACTIPVLSCECERSANDSALWRLHRHVHGVQHQ